MLSLSDIFAQYLFKVNILLCSNPIKFLLFLAEFHMPQIQVAILSLSGNLTNFHLSGSLTNFQPTWTIQVPKYSKVNGDFSVNHFLQGFESYAGFVDRTNIYIGACDGKKHMSFFKSNKFHRTIPKSIVPSITSDVQAFQGRIGDNFILTARKIQGVP